jgi:hypothetical protein
MRVGDTVAFEIRRTKDGAFEIAKISPVAPSPASKGSMKGDTTGSKK